MNTLRLPTSAWVLALSALSTVSAWAEPAINVQIESTYRVEGTRLIGLETRMVTRVFGIPDEDDRSETIVPSHDTFEILPSGRARLQDLSDEEAPIDAELAVAELQRSGAPGSDGVMTRLVIKGSEMEAVYAERILELYGLQMKAILAQATGRADATPGVSLSDVTCTTELSSRIMTCLQSVRFGLVSPPPIAQ